MDLEPRGYPPPTGALGTIEEIFPDFLVTFRAGDFPHLLTRIILRRDPISFLNEDGAAFLVSLFYTIVAGVVTFHS